MLPEHIKRREAYFVVGSDDLRPPGLVDVLHEDLVVVTDDDGERSLEEELLRPNKGCEAEHGLFWLEQLGGGERS